jgi:hypothetical protein
MIVIGIVSFLHHRQTTYITQLANYTTVLIGLINIKEAMQIRNSRVFEFFLINAYFIGFFNPTLIYVGILVIML